MSENFPTTVCLDGAAVRRIREEKKLTQLYVAKVVGVTTDTISRWENNRYPSIKRDNALRLAEAIETPLESIIQSGIVEGDSDLPQDTSSPPILSRKPVLLVLLVLVLVLSVALYFFMVSGEISEIQIGAKRILPTFAAPEKVVPVRIRLEADQEMKGFILREHFPPGWKLVEASPPPSSLDNEEGTVRWIIRGGDTRRTISYLVKVDPEAESGTGGYFSGEIIANPNGYRTIVSILGDKEIQVGPYLWADLNGDYRVDDAEMLLASDAVDEMAGIHIDWKQLEAIWDSGGYRWDQNRQQFVKVKVPHPLDEDAGPLDE